MGVSPLHKLVEMIRDGEFIQDGDLLESLGRDGTIVVPIHGGERRLPSGEILSVLADGAGLSMDDVLKRSFRMAPDEIDSASAFIRLVQFAGEDPPRGPDGSVEQPFQSLDR
jgi:hypothetical protein